VELWWNLFDSSIEIAAVPWRGVLVRGAAEPWRGVLVRGAVEQVAKNLMVPLVCWGVMLVIRAGILSMLHAHAFAHEALLVAKVWGRIQVLSWSRKAAHGVGLRSAWNGVCESVI